MGLAAGGGVLGDPAAQVRTLIGASLVHPVTATPVLAMIAVVVALALTGLVSLRHRNLTLPT